MSRARLYIAVAVAWSGCGLLDGGGGGGGGGGTSFTSGFTYVRKDDRNVYLADLAAVDEPRALTTTGGARTPSLSPDGQQVVFVRGTGADAALLLVPVSGGPVSTLLTATATVRNFRGPVFSPDGTRVAFTYDDGTLASRVGLINTDGSGLLTVAGSGALSYASPTFFPSGDELLVAAGNTGAVLTQVERVSLTGVVAPVTSTLGAVAQAIGGRLAVSPDGARAAFDARVASGVTRLFLLDLGSRAVTQLNDYVAEPSANDSFPSWVDASTVAYSSDSGGNDNVYRIAIDGTGRRLVLPTGIEPWFGSATVP